MSLRSQPRRFIMMRINVGNLSEYDQEPGWVLRLEILHTLAEAML